jgi:hypothetical protein
MSLEEIVTRLGVEVYFWVSLWRPKDIELTLLTYALHMLQQPVPSTQPPILLQVLSILYCKFQIPEII